MNGCLVIQQIIPNHKTDSSKFMKRDQYLQRIVILESIMCTPWDIKKEEIEKLSNLS